MARKKKNIATYQLDGSFPSILEGFIESGLKFVAGLGKYSNYIEFENNTKYKFLIREQTKRTFIGYNMIVRDLKRPEVSVILSDLEDATIERENQYFDLTLYSNKFFKSMICVDINSAYLQALFNLGLITENTKSWIDKTLTKQERLVAVGMLAKKKQICHFANGEEVQEYYDTSKHRFVFNAAIQEVNRVMSEIKRHQSDSFVFYWVDGIYLTNEYVAFDVLDHLNANNYPSKIEYLTDFKSRNTMSYMEYTFVKDGKKKLFNVPIDSVYSDIRKSLLDLLRGRRRLTELEKIDIETNTTTFVQSELWQKNH